MTLGTLLDEDTTEGPSERARLMWPCRDPGNSGAEGRRLFRSPLAARQLPTGASPHYVTFLNSVQIGSRPATKVQALASPATKLPGLGCLAARVKERRQVSISSLCGSRCALELSSMERGSAVASASWQCTCVHCKTFKIRLKFRVRTFTCNLLVGLL